MERYSNNAFYSLYTKTQIHKKLCMTITDIMRYRDNIKLAWEGSWQDVANTKAADSQEQDA